MRFQFVFIPNSFTFQMSKQPKQKPARHWVITQNDEKCEPQFDPEKMRFLVYQLEEAPTTGHVHYQGYVQMLKPTTFAKVSALFPKAYVAVANGSPSQNYDYCTKAESRMQGTEPKSFGVMSKGQGSRTDWDTLKTMIKEKKVDFDIADRFPQLFACHYKGIAHLRRTLQPASKIRDVRGRVLYGEPGVGKSRRIWQRFGHDPERLFAPDLSKGTLWFDGYVDQEALLLDDFTGREGISLQQLNRYLDPYPLRLPIKGSMGFANWTQVYITSNFHPADWYPNATPVELNSLLRRLSITQVRAPPPILIRPHPATVQNEYSGSRIISLLSDDEEEDDEECGPITIIDGTEE